MADQPDTYEVLQAEQVLTDDQHWRPTGRTFRSTYRLGGAPVLLSVEIQATPDAEWLPLPPPGPTGAVTPETTNGAAS